MPATKKTKIVATIGPASEDEKTLARLIKTGVDVVRLNFSHGDFEEHQARVDRARAISDRQQKPVAIMQDLAGPEIRIGEFAAGSVTLKKGKTFTLTTKKTDGDENRVHVNYPKLPKEVEKGATILLDDGKLRLEVTEIDGSEVHTKVRVGGTIKGRRGVNVPGAHLSLSSVTKKDKEDLEFGIKNDVDFIAFSFVRRPSDVDDLRRILKQKKSEALIIPKIETREAIENIDEIIERSDGIMVARGDLAIEIPNEQVPMQQKSIIAKCNRQGKPVITATQMLESMTGSPVPTRAEVSDVANAIIDGTDAVMLSGETALGDYPYEAVEVMARVARQTETQQRERVTLNGRHNGGLSTTDAVTQAVVNTAHDVGARAIVALTDTGFSARQIARHKPDPTVVAFSPNERTVRQLVLSYGVRPMKMEMFDHFDEAYDRIRDEGTKHKLYKKGDTIVATAGVPFHKQRRETNMMFVEAV